MRLVPNTRSDREHLLRGGNNVAGQDHRVEAVLLRFVALVNRRCPGRGGRDLAWRNKIVHRGKEHCDDDTIAVAVDRGRWCLVVLKGRLQLVEDGLGVIGKQPLPALG